MFSMNSFDGMRVLSLVRDGDYAHAGEEEAIALAMERIAKSRDQLIVDAGCGRGGTAHYLNANGWGKVVGFDIEPASIDFARTAYPNVDFYVSDVCEFGNSSGISADVICMFNAFYCFSDQARALRSLCRIAKPETQLVVFDHVNRGGYDSHALIDAGKPFLPNPPVLSEFSDLLKRNGWTLKLMNEVHESYIRWYANLVSRIERSRSQIASIVGEAGFNHVAMLYRGLLTAAERQQLGAAIIYATPRF